MGKSVKNYFKKTLHVITNFNAKCTKCRTFVYMYFLWATFYMASYGQNLTCLLMGLKLILINICICFFNNYICSKYVLLHYYLLKITTIFILVTLSSTMEIHSFHVSVSAACRYYFSKHTSVLMSQLVIFS